MLRSRGKYKADDQASKPSSLAASSVLDSTDKVALTNDSKGRISPLRGRNEAFRPFQSWKHGASPSPLVMIIWCLCFFVALEMGYILSLGVFPDGELWTFYFGSFTKRNKDDSGEYYKYKVRHRGDKPPIDDYYSRRHIRDPVPLIVGGSDGSGTRAFVEILLRLNVPMVVEDQGTMDVHGKEIYYGAGWPAIVTKVLNVTRSASYDLQDLPGPLLESARTEIRKFLRSIQIGGTAMVEAEVGQTWATGVSWGFKAPASILLLPFFRDQLPAMKVLHIVRDGRDVALSENHSPVQKFYAYFYADASDRHKALLEEQELGKDARSNVKAMQLWNDWNKQVYEYGARYSDGKTLDVLVMRTEDLLHYPLESITLLADFVGSLQSSKELCCLSRKVGMDLGHSGGTDLLEDQYEAGDEGGGGSARGPPMVDPGDFAQIRRRFAEFAADTGQHGARRLSEGPANDDADLFKSGGKLASANHPGNDLDMLANGIQQHNQKGISPGDLSQVARVQKLLHEQRASTQKKPKVPQTIEQVELRYGKWVAALKNDSILSQKVHLEGRESLALFGYEPSREFMDIIPHLELLDGCDKSVNC